MPPGLSGGYVRPDAQSTCVFSYATNVGSTVLMVAAGADFALNQGALLGSPLQPKASSRQVGDRPKAD